MPSNITYPNVFTSSLTTVEAGCAFARRLREGILTPYEHTTIEEAFDYDVKHRYNLLDVSMVKLETARQLAKRHPLRAYDAVQLATAWLLNQDLMIGKMKPLTFICADTRLLIIAQTEGLITENPNNHP